MRGIRTTVTALLGAITVLALLAGSAEAASTHPYVATFPTGPGCAPNDIANDAAGNVYVSCTGEGLNEKRGSIRKFNANGAPVPFTANVPYVSSNEINENPASPNGEFGLQNFIDVDTSNGVRAGYIYVFNYWGSGSVDVFDPAGKYVTTLASEWANGSPDGVGIDQNGFIYISYESFYGGHITKFEPQTFQEIKRIQPGREDGDQYGPCCARIRPDNTGAVWVEWGGAYFDGNGSFGKYEAGEFNDNLKIKYGEKAGIVVGHQSPYLNEKFEIEAFPSLQCPEKGPIATFGGNTCALEGHSFDTDLSNNDVYANVGTKIVPYSGGVAGDPVHQNGPAFGEPYLNNGSFGTGEGVAIDKSGNVYTTAEPDKIVKFGKGNVLPTVTTKEIAIADIGHTTATLRGTVDPAGGGQIESCGAKFGKSVTYGSGLVNCTESTPYPDGSPKEVSVELSGLEVGKNYHYRFQAGNGSGTNFGGDRVFEAKAVLNLETKAATDVDQDSATLNGQLDPDGIATEYWYEYGASTSYGLETAAQPVSGPSGTVQQTSAPLTHIQSGHTYHYRLVAENELGTTHGADLTLRTASAPEITGVGDENVADSSADLHATINPVGFETEYWFEYGTTPGYGQSIPASKATIGSGNAPVAVNAHLEGLTQGATIHYRVIATNKWGTSTSDDTTFDFRPPECPNAHVRALTGANYLPDCRAYELVTPGYAGAVQILPAEGLFNFAATFSGYAESPVNFGYANSPSRFSYMGGLGSVAGQDAPNSIVDVYLATRTNTGWTTAMPGLKGNETLFGFGRNCSDDQDVCADYIGPRYEPGENNEQHEVPKSNSPYLYKADGTRLGRLPTNVNTVKGGDRFKGDQQFSGDFSQYFFSTQTKFAPEGSTAVPGSVYRNDLAAKTVEVISYDANGDPIEAEPSVAGDPNRVTGIAGVSDNGRRILLAGTTNPYCNVNEYPFRCAYMLKSPARLYMRDTSAKLTYEVSRGKEVNFVDMTRDGSQVVFVSSEKFSPQDTDTSADLYRWTEAGDKITLLSQNGALGNSDSCNPTWISQCGVEQLTPEFFNGSEYFELIAHVKGNDDLLANESGDVYFYSPEDLAPGIVGGDNERNLYLYRNGHIQFVATMDPGTQIERSTIAPDGRFAAFVTKSRLTAYDPAGHREAYVYDADLGQLRCASCNPSGSAPTAAEELTVSEGGPFMANDGRTFFTSKESLVPQDTDGIRDVYEYVGGHPRLISTGTGNHDSTGGLELLSAFFGSLRTGLESVSRDGTDVYFSTFETLAPEDKNGDFLKIYDARTSGGFDFAPDLGPCVAADECHGAGSAPAAEPVINTGASLGGSGNLPEPGKARGHRKKQVHKKRHRRGHRARRGHRNG